MVSIVAFQAVDRGSIPRWRRQLLLFFFSFLSNQNNAKVCQKWDSNPRPHQWTRTLSVTLGLKEQLLESGALDHSAILTWRQMGEIVINKVKKLTENKMLQVRFELTTSAFLAPITAYKYGALTDCATGAANFMEKMENLGGKNYILWLEKGMGPTILARLHHRFHSRMLSHYYSAWRLWAAVFRPWPGSPLLRQPGGLGLPHNHHIDTELNADILSTWRTMEENPQPQAIHHTQFSSSWVTEASHHLQLLGD